MSSKTTRNNRIINDVLSGKTLEQVGRKHGVSRQRISQIVRRAGVTHLSDRRSIIRTVEPARRKIVTLLENGYRDRAVIAVKAQCSYNYVRQVATQHGYIHPKHIQRKEPDNYRVMSHGCWYWLGSISCFGYAIFKGKRAHRMVFEKEKGVIPKGHRLANMCGHKYCVNPDHWKLYPHRGGSYKTARNKEITHGIH